MGNNMFKGVIAAAMLIGAAVAAAVIAMAYLGLKLLGGVR